MDHDKQQHGANNNNATNNNNSVSSEPPSLRAVRPAWSMHPHIQRTPSMKRRQQQQQQQQQQLEQQQRVDAVIQALPQPPVPAAPPSPRLVGVTQSPPRSASSTSSASQVFFPPTPAAATTATTSPAESTRGSPRHSPAHAQGQAGQAGQVSRGSSEDYDLVCKVMLLGDSGVGKTCLLVRFQNGFFLSGNFISTVGVDFRNKLVTVDSVKVKLQIWDTAGQERFRSVTHAYYRDAHALLLLYDVTNKTSFDNIRAWLGEIREYAQDDVVIMLLGNKADCSERVVRREDGERLAREYSVAFMETSAKTGLNVEVAFMAVARELKSRKSGNPDDNRFNVRDFVREHQAQRPSCPPCST
ncbi:ras-related protein Rab-37 isoform X1 [Thrips palmi]|uniref:small monomeric GTPase n=1 Tax=Thrips palmi TaxID=161013 RepID=A0A6P8YTE0_THRPL|nr:ras-related protein Rab-37 isoform X1 [Thrips palmi]